MDRLTNLPRVTHVRAKMGTVKDRNGMDLTEAEDIKKGGKNTHKYYAKKIFMI